MKAIFIILLFTISGCLKENSQEMKMSVYEDEQIRYCIGRTVLAVPNLFTAESTVIGSFKFVGMGVEEPSIDVAVETNELNKLKFERRLKLRSAELRNAGDETINILKHEQRLNEDAYLFRVQEIDDAYVSEVIVLKGSNLVIARMHSFRNQYDLAENKIIELISKISVKEDSLVHDMQGFCLGPVVIDGDFQEETGRFLYRSKNGINFNINIDTYMPDERVPLLRRVSGSESLLARFQVKHKVLRARERTVAGMRAQEWLSWAETGPSENQGSYGFAIETMRVKPGKLSPSIRLSMDSSQPLVDGTPTTTLISGEEAIGLWDSIVDSIRPANHPTQE